MKKVTELKEKLEYIKQFQDSFQFKEEAMLAEYGNSEFNKSDLAIKVVTIIGGFIASLLFLGLLLVLGLYTSKMGMLIFGILFVVFAILFQKFDGRTILETFSVSFYLIGNFLIAMGMDVFNGTLEVTTFFLGLISIITLIITHSYILAFIAILLLNGCIATVLLKNQNHLIIQLYISFLISSFVYLILNEGKIITFNEKLSILYKPIRIGVIFSILGFFSIVAIRSLVELNLNYNCISSGVNILFILYLMPSILETMGYKTNKGRIITIVLSLLILLPTVYSPAISGSILIVLLCFKINYPIGLIIGGLSFIYFLSQYYYDLAFTLLTKSILLFCSGILFLLVYLFTFKQLNSNE